MNTYYVPHTEYLTSWPPLFSAILQCPDDSYRLSRSGWGDPETLSMYFKMTQLRYD